MKATSTRARRLFVLDTNVLMHDPTAIFRFEEHDIYLPMVVLEELDANKKGLSEASRNARQVSRFLDDMMPRRHQGADRRRAADSLRAAPTITASSRRPGGCSSRRASCGSGLPDGPARARRRQPDPRPDAVAAAAAAADARRAGVQGHQPAHQGRHRRRARRGLLQRQDHRRRRRAVHRQREVCRRTSGNSTAATCARGRKAIAPGTRSAAPAVADWHVN